MGFTARVARRYRATRPRPGRAGGVVVAAFANSLFGIIALALCVLAVLASCSKGTGGEARPRRVVVVTPAESASPRAYKGAESFVASCSIPTSPVEAARLTYPEAPKWKLESATADLVEKAASDPLVAAIVLVEAPSGGAEGFRRVKAARPELLCVALDPQEDELEVQSSADLVVGIDRLYRAFMVAWEAKKMGAAALVSAYSFAGAADPEALRERAIMSAAAAELGLGYKELVAPEAAEAGAFARERIESLLSEDSSSGGRDLAFYCAERSLVEPLLAGAIAGRGMVVDAAGEATSAAYAQALGLDLASAKGEPRKERKLVEDAAVSRGLKGRLGLWDSGYEESVVEGLCEYASRVARSKAAKGDLKDLAQALDSRSGGAAWLVDYEADPGTGVKSANGVLLRQDVYVLGKGYLQSALQQVPGKYLRLEAGNK